MDEGEDVKDDDNKDSDDGYKDNDDSDDDGEYKGNDDSGDDGGHCYSKNKMISVIPLCWEYNEPST